MAAVAGRPNRWASVAKLVVALAATGVLTAGVFMPFVLGSGLIARNYASKWLDTTCDLQDTKPPQPTTLYADDHRTVLARLFTQDRKEVPLSKVPTYLQDALIATEDRRFYSHHGVDMRGLLRSAVNTSNGETQGGSTLTMQYVKQSRYYQAGDNVAKQQAAIAVTVDRKMEDAKCALDIEGPRHWSKQKILQNYLNIAFFGEHAYGIEVAAETYFAVPVNKLTLGQSAMLVGLLRAPTAYDPFQHLAAAKQRRDEVLQNLVAVGKLSQSEADRQKALPLSLASQNAPEVRQGCATADTTIKNAAFFCEYAVRWLEDVNKIDDKTLQTGGLSIVTTIDPTVQNNAQKAISAAVPATSPMTSVLPVVNPKTGDVLAMAASKSYGTTPRTQTEQSIFTGYTAFGASTYKMFALVAALETGVPGDWLLKTVGNTGTYKSTNCVTPSKTTNGDANVPYTALETLATATAKSSNTYYVALADKLLDCQLGPIVDVMSRLGMKGMQQPSDLPHLTWAQAVVAKQRAQQLVLGSIPTSPLELAAAYGAIANKGVYNTPSPIVSITTQTGESLQVRRTPATQAIDPQTAARASNILQGDTKKGGTAASQFQQWYSGSTSAKFIAGKTGTNESNKANENGSIWFVGMTPNLVGASGVINFDQSSAPSSGLPKQKTGTAYGDYAAKIWLSALGPTLRTQSWKWQDPEQVTGNDVPNIKGKTIDDARAMLSSQGYKLAIFGESSLLMCPSAEPLESVAFYAPTRAPTGSTITVCESSSSLAYEPPKIYYPPTKNKRTKTPGSGAAGTGASQGSPGAGQGGQSNPAPTKTKTRTRHRGPTG